MEFNESLAASSAVRATKGLSEVMMSCESLRLGIRWLVPMDKLLGLVVFGFQICSHFIMEVPNLETPRLQAVDPKETKHF